MKTHSPFNSRNLSRFGITRLGVVAVFLPILVVMSAIADTGGYRLKVDDLVGFQVSGESDLTANVRVAADGTAIFPLVGAVPIGGKTVSEATAELVARLKKGYLGNPQVILMVSSYGKQYFTVLGQVSRPGSYDLAGLNHLSLLQAIGMAGGYTRIANASNVVIKRQVPSGGAPQTFHVNLRKMATDPAAAANIMIYSGDVITVPEALF